MARIDIKSSNTGGGGGGGNLQLAGGASMTTTLTAVTDTSNVASPLKLSTAAVQVTSPLRITTSDASGFYLDAEDSATNNRFSIKRDPSAQEVTLDFASNPSGSTTLVGAIRTYRDGVNLSAAMSFIEDGSVGIGTSAPVGILHLYKSAAATRLAIDGDAGQNRLISYRTGALQRFGLYVNNTAETGSNAGSNFAIRAYNDAGTLLSTPLFIERATGNVGIGTTTPASPFSIVNTIALAAGATNPRIENIAYTINNSGAQTGTATGIFLNATETNLNGQTHNLMDLQRGGVSNFKVGTFWDVGFKFNTSQANNYRPLMTLSRIGDPTSTLLSIGAGSGPTSTATYIATGNDDLFFGTDISSTFTTNIILPTSGVGRILLGGITSSFPSIKRNGTAIDFRLADDSAVCGINTGNINVTGFVLISANLEIGGSSYMGFGNRSLFRSPSDGVLTLLNYDSNDFSRLQFGGTTSSFPSIKRNGTAIDFRLADDSAFAQYTGRVGNYTTAAKNALTVAAGALVYDTTLNKLSVYNGASWETVTSV